MNKEIILGIHCGYQHDSGAALIVDNKIVAAVAEERVSRVKKDPYFPEGSIKKCLEIGGKTMADLTHVSFGVEEIQYQPSKKSKDYFDSSGGYFTSRKRPYLDKVKFNLNKILGITPFAEMVKNKLTEMGAKSKVTYGYYDHHMCHMASVFFTSGNVKAESGYIFVVDGKGDDKSVSAYRFFENKVPDKILDMPATSSPGILYQNTTVFLGYKPNRHEGKITGLAGYGDPKKLYEETEKYLRYSKEEKRFVVELHEENSVKRFFRRSMVFLLNDKIGIKTPNFRRIGVQGAMAKDFKGASREDIAASTQKRFDDEILNFVKDVIGDDKPDSILLAGGIFANVKTNGVISDQFPTAEMYIHPGMTDEGIALGAALMGNYKMYGHTNRLGIDNVYLGSDYDNQIASFSEEFSGKYSIESFSEIEAEAKQVAQLIDKGQIVGLFQGGMEYGPRALGNRTILADPRDKQVNDRLNKRLDRTEFMPFAPVIMKEHAAKVFDFEGKNIEYACNFMTIITNVKPEWREKIPAVVHVDNTARPQIITREQNPLYYDIINSFYELTGVPLLINTSFNVHEEPIVESPKDAIRSLDLNCVDFVCFPQALFSRKNVTPDSLD